MRVLDPLGELAQAPQSKVLHELASLENQRIGFVWGQHAASVKFWPVFEEIAEQSFKPSSVHKLYKDSTWNPATDEQVERFSQEIDIALIGVGA